MEGCYDALLTGTVEAVVSDAPNLLYYAKHQGQGQVAVVGKLFAPQGMQGCRQLNALVLAHKLSMKNMFTSERFSLKIIP